nr:hypothetical protein [Tanacetum cinerariifolium]
MNRLPQNDDGEIKKIEPNLTDVQVDTRLEREFANWFNDYARDSDNVDSQTIKDVASGPLRSVVTYPVYFVNREQDDGEQADGEQADGEQADGEQADGE